MGMEKVIAIKLFILYMKKKFQQKIFDEFVILHDYINFIHRFKRNSLFLDLFLLLTSSLFDCNLIYALKWTSNKSFRERSIGLIT